MDVKSADRSMTLLQYFAEFCEAYFPEVLDCQSELDIHVEKGGKKTVHGVTKSFCYR